MPLAIIGKQDTGPVVHDLMHLDLDAPIVLRVKSQRLHMRIDLAPLLQPVTAHLCKPTDKPPLNAYGQAVSGSPLHMRTASKAAYFWILGGIPAVDSGPLAC
ncbi:MAG: hypothetical protein J0L73_19705 [Verrucomicrobia bacterium]|nr:hypothetical protein [Verrucomicrobiota bacterium]